MMTDVPVSRRTALLLGSSALLGACAKTPEAAPAPASTPEAPSPSPSSASPTPSSASPAPSTPSGSATASGSGSPSATASQPPLGTGSLVVGKNHNAGAEAYAFSAKDVHTWLKAGGGPDKKVAFLTFDDGPNTTLTPLMLDKLRELGVPATFFVIGRLVPQAPQMLKRAIDEGHAVCLHSYSHDYKYLYPGRVGSAKNVGADTDKGLAALKQALGESFKTTGYRYPGGHLSWKKMAGPDQELAQRGLWWIDWNCMSGDADKAKPSTASGMVGLMASTLTQKPQAAVVLNHDADPTGRLTLEALPGMVTWLKNKGYTFGVIA